MDKSSKSELEKCLDGEFYNCHDSIFIEYKAKARRLIKEYRNLDYLDKEGKRKILEQLFNKIDSKERINSNFDENEYFAKTYAQPVMIKDNAFIGGGCIILPGVTIGKGTVVGAGSVVTKSLRDHYLCYENPCREIRKID